MQFFFFLISTRNVFKSGFSFFVTEIFHFGFAEAELFADFTETSRELTHDIYPYAYENADKNDIGEEFQPYRVVGSLFPCIFHRLVGIFGIIVLHIVLNGLEEKGDACNRSFNFGFALVFFVEGKFQLARAEIEFIFRDFIVLKEIDYIGSGIFFFRLGRKENAYN